MSRDKTSTALVLLFCLSSSAAWAAPAEPEYPELLVTPRASERVESEARREGSARWQAYLPIQASALTTFVAGALHQGDPAKATNSARITGLAVGGAWLATTALLSANHRPYEDALDELNAMARKSPREQLARERMAEEAIEAEASLMRRLNWMSVASNLGGGIYMMSQAKRDFDKVSSGLAIAGSLAPIVFCSRAQRIAADQRSYKKRIFGPIAQVGMIPAPGGTAAPGALLSFSFY